MTCVRCLVAFQARELTGAYESPVEGVTDRPLRASVVFGGESLCDRHFNVVRGHEADFLQYPQEVADAYAHLNGMLDD